MRRSVDQVLDEYLVIQCQIGDRRSFASLIERYQARVIHLALAKTADREAANDVAQEVWANVIKSIRRLNDPAKFRPWLDQLVRHKSTDWIRRRQRLRRHVRPLGEEQVSDDRIERDDEQRSRAASVSKLRNALSKLPEPQRKLLTRFYLDERSVSDIATELAIPEGTVKSRLYHAREQLKRACERNEE